MSSPEQLPSSAEQGAEVSESAAEQLEKLSKSLETGSELSKEGLEKTIESTTIEAKEKAVSTEAGGAEKDHKEPSAPPKRHGAISKKEKAKSFKRHLQHVQSELPTASRIFSKFIHNKAVETTSDFVGATVARPNAILTGAFVAFLLVLGVYILAKSLGYVLSGFETIAAFIVGWLLGAVYDYVKVLLTGKRT
jgi:hypothetical protein